MGINIDNLLISQPDSAENLLSVVDTLTKSGAVSVIVVDSVCIFPPYPTYNTKLHTLRLRMKYVVSLLPRFVFHVECELTQCMTEGKSLCGYPSISR